MILLSQSTFNGASGTNFLLSLYYTLNSQNLENNTSNVTYTATIKSRNGFSGSGAALQYTINGIGGSSGVTSVPVNTEVTLGTKTENIEHNSNGDSSPTVTATCNSTWSGLGNASTSGLYSLPQIIRGILRTKLSGVWKSGVVYIKVSGVWKRATGVYTKVSGVWKQGR